MSVTLQELKIPSDKNPVSMAEINPPELLVNFSLLQIPQYPFEPGYSGAIVSGAEVDLNTTTDHKNSEPSMGVPANFRDESPW
jgi:hypothetical protein